MISKYTQMYEILFIQVNLMKFNRKKLCCSTVHCFPSPHFGQELTSPFALLYIHCSFSQWWPLHQHGIMFDPSTQCSLWSDSQIRRKWNWKPDQKQTNEQTKYTENVRTQTICTYIYCEWAKKSRRLAATQIACQRRPCLREQQTRNRTDTQKWPATATFYWEFGIRQQPWRALYGCRRTNKHKHTHIHTIRESFINYICILCTHLHPAFDMHSGPM